MKYKIKTSVAFVDDNGNAVETGDEVVVTKEFLDTQNEVLTHFGLPLHEVLEEINDELKAETTAKAKAAPKGEADKQPDSAEV